MATKTNMLITMMLLAFMLYSREATAQSSCTSTLLTLSSCLNFVTGNTTTPSTTCCSSLGSVVQSNPRCLCTLLSSGSTGSALGLSINQTLAMALPALCNVQTPPISQCNAGANGPAASAPAPSPVAVTSSPTDDASTQPADDNPTTTNVPSVPSGSKTVPKTGGSTSDGSYITSFGALTAFALFVAAVRF